MGRPDTAVPRLQRHGGPPVTPARFPAALRAHIEALGLTNAQYAASLGVHERTVYRWLTGQSRPHRRVLTSIPRYAEDLARLPEGVSRQLIDGAWPGPPTA